MKRTRFPGGGFLAASLVLFSSPLLNAAGGVLPLDRIPSYQKEWFQNAEEYLGAAKAAGFALEKNFARAQEILAETLSAYPSGVAHLWRGAAYEGEAREKVRLLWRAGSQKGGIAEKARATEIAAIRELNRQALESYKSAAQFFPRLKTAHERLADCAFHQERDLVLAQAHALKCWEMDPEDSAAALNLAEIYAAAGQWEDAQSVLARLDALNPDPSANREGSAESLKARRHEVQGKIFLVQKNFSAAALELEKSARADPSRASVWEGLARAYQARQQTAFQRSALENWIGCEPRSVSELERQGEARAELEALGKP